MVRISSRIHRSGEAVLGKSDATPSAQIDTFEVEGDLETVTFETSDLTAICPVTGGPDIYDCTVEYSPGRWCIETKSLKLYLETFRNVGIFAEHLAPKLAGHLAAAVEVEVRVTLRQHIRGGIVTTVVAGGPTD